MSFSLLLAKENNYLRHTFLINNQLNLIFKYEVESINHFTIKSKNVTKHVFDIKNAVLPKTQDISQYKVKGIKAFRVGQFNKKIMRVVIETTIPMSGSYVISGRKLVFNISSTKKIQKELKKYNYNLKRSNKTIILDAGHGGRDVGASKNKIYEKDLTLNMTIKLKRILQEMGYRVLLTHSNDTFMNLKQRTEYANNHRGSLFVSIHANAAPLKRNPKVLYKGIEIYYLSIKNSKRIKNKRAEYRGKKVYSKQAYKIMTSPWKYLQSHKLAYAVKKNILTNVSPHYRINDKGVKRRDFWVLLATKMPSILVETGYLTDKDELKKLKNTHYQKLLMEGIAKGINEYYRLY